VSGGSVIQLRRVTVVLDDNNQSSGLVSPGAPPPLRGA
jgi:hypothetical protein